MRVRVSCHDDKLCHRICSVYSDNKKDSRDCKAESDDTVMGYLVLVVNNGNWKFYEAALKMISSGVP